MMVGGFALALSVVGVGHVTEPWQIYLFFSIMGVSYACLGTTGISTTLAPWFERHQGRAISIALMGASVGGMIGSPLLLLAIATLGFGTTTLLAGAFALVIVVPIALFVLRQSPQHLGLFPDGERAATDSLLSLQESKSIPNSIGSAAFLTVVLTFGLALSMQLGFLTHHVSLITPSLGDAGASFTVFATGLAALAGRLLLSRYADQVDLRITTAGLLATAAAAFAVVALIPNRFGLVGGSILYGLTLGNITSLSPIIIRREFGARSFGNIYGVASTIIGLGSAFGPSIWGMLHDSFGSYTSALLISAALDAIAATIILTTRPTAGPY